MWEVNGEQYKIEHEFIHGVGYFRLTEYIYLNFKKSDMWSL